MKPFIAVLVLLLGAFAVMAQAPKTILKIGDKAPEFALPNGDGKLVSLSEVTTRVPVVLVFYRGYW